jgi:hypothetical protein
MITAMLQQHWQATPAAMPFDRLRLRRVTAIANAALGSRPISIRMMISFSRTVDQADSGPP